MNNTRDEVYNSIDQNKKLDDMLSQSEEIEQKIMQLIARKVEKMIEKESL